MEEGWDVGRGGAPKVGAASCIEKGNVYRVESHMWGGMLDVGSGGSATYPD